MPLIVLSQACITQGVHTRGLLPKYCAAALMACTATQSLFLVRSDRLNLQDG